MHSPKDARVMMIITTVMKMFEIKNTTARPRRRARTPNRILVPNAFLAPGCSKWYLNEREFKAMKRARPKYMRARILSATPGNTKALLKGFRNSEIAIKPRANERGRLMIPACPEGRASEVLP